MLSHQEQKDNGMVNVPETEEELQRVMEERLQSVQRLSLEECLFCGTQSTSLFE